MSNTPSYMRIPIFCNLNYVVNIINMPLKFFEYYVT